MTDKQIAVQLTWDQRWHLPLYIVGSQKAGMTGWKEQATVLVTEWATDVCICMKKTQINGKISKA